eukprot:11192369-Lingulodinium_polyedra.AAC.1
MAERSNVLRDKAFREPWYHRRGRVQPGKLRKITETLVGPLKEKTQQENAWDVCNKPTYFMEWR